MRVLSLFDGISCGRIALDRAGLTVSEYVAFENDDVPKKISKANYPDIIHHADVFDGNFKDYTGFDLLIGGSPCTHWSIAKQNRERETKPEGIGYDLFMQYVRALREAKPKYFIYENNFSISKDIKAAITEELGVEPIMINSQLVSAQHRKRMYWTNIPNVVQPEERNILLSDVLTEDRKWFPLQPWCLNSWGGKVKVNELKTIFANKSNCLTTNKTHPRNYYLNAERNMMTNLTAEEAEILQTVPVGYTSIVTEGKRFKALGNGWTVDVIAHILSFIGGF